MTRISNTADSFVFKPAADRKSVVLSSESHEPSFKDAAPDGYTEVEWTYLKEAMGADGYLTITMENAAEAESLTLGYTEIEWTYAKGGATGEGYLIITMENLIEMQDQGYTEVEWTY